MPGTLLSVEDKAAKKIYIVLFLLGENDSKETVLPGGIRSFHVGDS